MLKRKGSEIIRSLFHIGSFFNQLQSIKWTDLHAGRRQTMLYPLCAPVTLFHFFAAFRKNRSLKRAFLQTFSTADTSGIII